MAEIERTYQNRDLKELRKTKCEGQMDIDVQREL